MNTPKNDLFLKALQGATLDRPPVWMMRQAGRYLPDFMKLKACLLYTSDAADE